MAAANLGNGAADFSCPSGHLNRRFLQVQREEEEEEELVELVPLLLLLKV